MIGSRRVGNSGNTTRQKRVDGSDGADGPSPGTETVFDEHETLSTPDPATTLSLSVALTNPILGLGAVASAPQWSAIDDSTASTSCTSTVIATSSGGSASFDSSILGSLSGLLGDAAVNSVFQLSNGWMALSALQADTLRNAFGIDGTGVKIGVLSDSFNVLGGAAADMADGNLPASGVQVLQEGPAGSTDEGRAMLELIHQIAPGASLAFYSGDYSESNFANGITALTNAGCNIIVDDLTYLDEPFFQDGVIAQAVNAAAARGVAYFTAAGNEASNAYQAAFSPIAATLPDGTVVSNAQNFGGGAVMQSITMGAGAAFILQWDQAWGHATSNVDVRVYQGSTLLGDVTRFNSGEPNNPFLGFVNDSATTQTFQIAITNDGGPNPGLIKYILFGDGLPASINSFATNSGTLIGHEGASGAVTVAAANYTTPTQMEWFSSTGPAQILFDDSGNRLATPITTTVDLTGVDGFSTSVLSPFFGTSAAAPTIAALAALLEQAAPGASASAIEAALENTATDIGAPGVDNSSGSGLANGLAAGNAIATPHVYVGSNTFEKIYPGTGTNTISVTGSLDTVYVSKASNNSLMLSGFAASASFDYSLAPGAVTVNIASGIATHSFGGTDTFGRLLTIRGSAFNDTFVVATGAFGSIIGGGGVDTLDCSATSEALTVALGSGSSSVDDFGGTGINVGFNDIHIIKGGAGNTFVQWVTGSPTVEFIGGSGENTLDLAAGGGATVNIAAGLAADTIGDSIQFTNIQDFQTNSAATFIAGPGSHTFTNVFGGSIGTLDYSAAPTAIVANLSSDSVSNGYGGTDQFNAVTTIKGSNNNDIFIGGSGSHSLDGGGGVNTLDYSGASGAVSVNLATGTASNGFGGTDTLSNIEDVVGSSFADMLTAGNGGGETFTGGAGRNTFVFASGGGEDVITDFKSGVGGDQLELDLSPGTTVQFVTVTYLIATDFSGGDLAGAVGSSSSTILASGDFSGDGKSDFILTDAASGLVRDEVWNGIGYTTADLGAIGLDHDFLTSGDFSGNGLADLLWRVSDGTTTISLANGDGTFATAMIANTAGWNVLGTGDFNGDGRTDILWRSGDGSTGPWLFNGNGTFAGAIVANSQGWNVIGTGDFNGDGRTDVLWRSADGSTGPWLFNSNGTFAGTIIANTQGWNVLATGDFNGDGRADVLWRSADGSTGPWLFNSNGTFAGTIIANTAGWNVLGTGDFNDDGKTDVLWRSADGSTGAWLFNSDGTFTGGIAGNVGLNWSVASIGDLNSDGKADIVWRNSTDGSTAIWYMDGGTLLYAGAIAQAAASGNDTAYTAVTYGAGDNVNLIGVQASSLTSDQITPTIRGTAGSDILTGSIGNDTLIGNGGNDTYQIARGGGQDTIVNGLATNSGPTGTLAFGSGIDDDQLWFAHSGNDLQIDMMGSHDQVTVAGWFSNETDQLQQITTADGMKLDAQVAQLVQAMATYSTNNPGFDPTVATTAPNDPTLQNTIAASWHA
jgi:hypothetical protein